MKTKEENIEIVRAACVAANPTILKNDCRLCEGEYDGERPIRLADVLLAIRDNTGMNRPHVHINGEGLEIGHSRFWNCRKDDLTEQSEETLHFLATLLSETKHG